MKKLLLPLLLISHFSNAQRTYERQAFVNRPYLENEEENWILQINPAKKVKTVEWKGKKSLDKSYMLLDEKGYLTETKYTAYVRGFLFFWRKGHFHKKYEYTNLLCTKVDFYNKQNALVSSNQYEFFCPSKVRVSKTYKKDKLIFEGTSKFNPDTTTAEYKAVDYKQGVAKQRVRYENDYYSGKQLKESRQYNKKNKLVQVWKYDCDPKGEVKVKKTNQVCRNLGTDNKGREIEALFNTDYKGKKTKAIYTFYKVNGKRFNVTSEWFVIEKGKERKWYEEHYPDSTEKWFSYNYYNKKGGLSYEQKREYAQYNSKGILLKSETRNWYNRGKTYMSQVQRYNDKGQFLTCDYFGKKNRSIGKVTREYISDSLVLNKHYSKKGKLTKTHTCHISYY